MSASLSDSGVMPAWTLRHATAADVSAIESLMARSVRGLQRGAYSDDQIETALGSVFAVDRQLISDGTYFVAEHQGGVIAAGGWSRRNSHYGGDAGRVAEDALLDPRQDAARIRAFFVEPAWARRGIGRAILRRCEREIVEAGFGWILIVATLTGESLYASEGYAVTGRFEVPLRGGLALPVVRMEKSELVLPGP